MHHHANVHVGGKTSPGASFHSFASDGFVPLILSILAPFPLVLCLMGFHGWVWPQYVPSEFSPEHVVRTSPEALALVSLSIFCILVFAVWKHLTFYRTSYFVIRDGRGGKDVFRHVEKALDGMVGDVHGYTMSAHMSDDAHAEFTLEVRSSKSGSFVPDNVVSALRAAGFRDVLAKYGRESTSSGSSNVAGSAQ